MLQFFFFVDLCNMPLRVSMIVMFTTKKVSQVATNLFTIQIQSEQHPLFQFGAPSSCSSPSTCSAMPNPVAGKVHPASPNHLSATPSPKTSGIHAADGLRKMTENFSDLNCSDTGRRRSSGNLISRGEDIRESLAKIMASVLQSSGNMDVVFMDFPIR
uniref:Uncharacterized protein n=1 Tax=Ditylenchus dipsaci TaxID=166011 RepID=A0A915CPR1_9BILA